MCEWEGGREEGRGERPLVRGSHTSIECRYKGNWEDTESGKIAIYRVLEFIFIAQCGHHIQCLHVQQQCYTNMYIREYSEQGRELHPLPF